MSTYQSPHLYLSCYTTGHPVIQPGSGWASIQNICTHTCALDHPSYCALFLYMQFCFANNSPFVAMVTCTTVVLCYLPCSYPCPSQLLQCEVDCSCHCDLLWAQDTGHSLHSSCGYHNSHRPSMLPRRTTPAIPAVGRS